jgi:hypothetical protein
VTVHEIAARLGWKLGFAQGVLDLLAQDEMIVEEDGRYRLAPRMEPYRMAFRGLVSIDRGRGSDFEPIVFRHDTTPGEDKQVAA